MKQYAERDAMAMDMAGNYYCRHVSAMTEEGLHAKSDIAAELAWRDMEIDRLRKDAERYRTARCMTPYQWSAAWELNVTTGKPFDEIIDNMRPFVGGR